MTEPIERIILALDATVDTSTAIDTAMRLAGRAKARLHAIFVEDEELLSLAGLPVARQITAGAKPARLTIEDVELQLRAAALRAREEIVVAARTHSLECSFDTVRGSVGLALANTSERDLVVAGAVARPVAGHFRTASRWLVALDLVAGSFLFAGSRRRKTEGVAASVCEQGTGSARLLRAAARLAELIAEPLIVLCPPALATAKDFNKWVDEQIEPSKVKVLIEAHEPAALHQWLVKSAANILAVEGAAAEGQQLGDLMESFDGDIFVVP
jgi:hypothetical protein